jgi:hypothetical protein
MSSYVITYKEDFLIENWDFEYDDEPILNRTTVLADSIEKAIEEFKRLYPDEPEIFKIIKLGGEKE